jgi:hypothetical protein
MDMMEISDDRVVNRLAELMDGLDISSNQVLERLTELMGEVGQVTNRAIEKERLHFEVFSAVENTGAGVTVEADPVRFKVIVRWDQAMLVPHTDPIPAAAVNVDAPDGVYVLQVDHGQGTFDAPLRQELSIWSAEGRILMAIWAPEDPVDEELMQKGKSFVKHVFRRVGEHMEERWRLHAQRGQARR